MYLDNIIGIMGPSPMGYYAVRSMLVNSIGPTQDKEFR